MTYKAKITEVSWCGYPVYVRDATNDQAICNEVLGSDVYGLNKLTTIPQTILDIGSHIGTFIIHAKTLFPQSTVYGFEPLLDNFNMLKINTCHYTDVHIFNTALGLVDKPTTASLNIYPNNLGGNSIVQGTAITSTTAPCTLNNPLAYDLPPRFDIVKFDCEGCEVELVPLITQHFDCPWIVGEYHGEKAAHMLDNLAGYSIARTEGIVIGMFTATKINYTKLC
jgi:FkbM family methyltransferase